MSTNVTTAFWSFTINNYSPAQLMLVRQGYPDYCREIVHTLEVGEEGTPHIQGWIKLLRQQRFSFVKKLLPGAHLKPLTCAEYVENTKQYAQKQDVTAESVSVHKFNDPQHTIESVVRKVMIEIAKMMEYEEYSNKLLYDYRKMVEHEMVVEDYKYAKIFVSSTYKQMWKEFGAAMYANIFAAHTHTHTHGEKFSQEVDIPVENASGCEEDSASQTGSDASCSDEGRSESDEDCSSGTAEGRDEGSSDEGDEEDDEQED